MDDPRLGPLLDPDFTVGLLTLPLDEIRARRAQCSEVEVWLSYSRRLVQGRLDIVLAEVHRREVGGAVTDAASLVERLSEILADRVHAQGYGHLPRLMVPAEADLAAVGRLNAIVDADRLVALPELSEDQLGAAVDALSSLEHEVSAVRRDLHAVMDRLQEEMVRRYKSGEATVDGLLP